MELKDVTAENYFRKVTYSSAPEEEKEGKIVVTNGNFIQTAVLLRLIAEIQKLRMK